MGPLFVVLVTLGAGSVSALPPGVPFSTSAATAEAVVLDARADEWSLASIGVPWSAAEIMFNPALSALRKTGSDERMVEATPRRADTDAASRVNDAATRHIFSLLLFGGFGAMSGLTFGLTGVVGATIVAYFIPYLLSSHDDAAPDFADGYSRALGVELPSDRVLATAAGGAASLVVMMGTGFALSAAIIAGVQLASSVPVRP